MRSVYQWAMIVALLGLVWSAVSCAGATTSAPSAEEASAPSSSGTSAPQGSSAVARTFVFEVQPTTEARYRVREQLANLNFPSDAVGVTNAVTGKLVLNASGHVVPEESRIVVDLRQLRSDSEMRDNYLRRTTLQTSLYPAAEFAVKELAGLPWPLPASGELPIQVAGDLTIRGVTRPTMWDAVVTFNGDEVSGLATTSFRFADFGMRVPTVLVVLSVEDNIRAELDFRFRMLEQ